MIRGKVKHIVAVRGYGFISATPGQPDYFFHIRDCKCDFAALKAGDAVAFDIVQWPKDGRMRAIDVTLVS